MLLCVSGWPTGDHISEQQQGLAGRQLVLPQLCRVAQVLDNSIQAVPQLWLASFSTYGPSVA